MDDSDETRSERQLASAGGRMHSRAAESPVVFLVPGLMAVRLKDGQGRAWLSRAGVAAGGLQRLALGPGGVGGEGQPDGLIPAAYRPLVEHLRTGFEVIPFPYDWRRSALDAGAGLAAAVRSELRRHDRPIHLLAHSTGGLVGRAMIAQDGAAWDQVCGRGGRLVLLGTPHGGSYAALQLLAGAGRLAQMLALLDPKRSRRAVAGVTRSWPGLFELLPEAAALEGWEDSGWRSPEVQQLLSDARQVRASLQGAVDPGHMCCVTGIAQETPCGVRVGADGQLKFLANDDGDGVVTSAAAGLPGVPTWCVAAAHGDMPRQEAVLRATADLLRRGATDALPRWFPAGAAGPAFELPDKAFIPRPDEWELLAAALGATAPGRAGRETYPLRVSVAHGSLQYARFPVAVGHYRGDTIVGAERFLDGRLGGRLTRRQEMNLYPGDVGTAEVLLAPGCTPPGGLVIGLGEVGEIAPEVITRGVMEAALRLALEVAEGRRAAGAPGWGSAALSALLIGTGGGRSLSIENSVAAIVKGVILANRALRERGLWDRVRIDEVEFIELYQDLATRAAYAVRNLGAHLRIALEEQEVIEPAVHLQLRPGRLVERPANEFATGWWRRLQVSEMAAAGAPGAGALQFVLLTDQARAEESLEPTQRALVDQIIERTIRDPFNQDLPATLYELLLPNSLKELTYEIANLQLVLDRGAARYPWEMLAERDRNGVASPIANSMGVLRQLRTARFRAQVQYARGGALVIGEPYTENRALYPPLPGAAAEAEAVARLLEESGYRDVVRLIGSEATALKIVDALFAREYRIIHIAAHGIYDPDHPEKSGVVIGDGVYLTPAELAKLRVLPELVFLNCCHLGKIDPQAPAASLEREPVERAWSRLAASVSGELIELGVRAVVAAGWAVDDAAANCFATEFYQGMLAAPGQQFGEAVWRARQQTYRGYAARTNTWGAYQCYGDPGFAFGPRGAGAAAERQDPVAAHEIVRELEEIRRRAPAADTAGRAADLVRARWLIRTMPAGWRSGRLLCALAAAYAALGELRDGVAAYQEALAADGSSEELPLVTLERLADVEARYALELRGRAWPGRAAGAASPAAPDPDEEDRRSLLKDAAGRLEQWLSVARTPPHLALAGGLYRRLALAGRGAERTQALKRAAACYREAYEMQSRAGPAVDPSYALGWITCSWLSDRAAPAGRSRELLALIDRSIQAAAETAGRAPGFPARVPIADGALLRALVAGNLDERRAEIAGLYRVALGTGAGPAERASVSDQFEFLIEMAAWRGRGRMANSLRGLREAISV